MEFRAYGRREIWPWLLDLSVSTKMFLRLKIPTVRAHVQPKKTNRITKLLFLFVMK